MPEILEGKFHVMHQDPKAIHEANKVILLLFMSLATAVPVAHLTLLFGFWLGEMYIKL